MRRALALVSLSLLALLGGCARPYGSFYRQTERDLMPRPVPPDRVEVVRSASHLRTPWIELGRYEGHAPTVKEAMDAARHTCGRAGADRFILGAEPLESRGAWRVEGVCAARPVDGEPPTGPGA